MSDEARAGYTRHGHPIPGAALYPLDRPPVARCGGPRLCTVCHSDVSAWQAANASGPLDEARAEAERRWPVPGPEAPPRLADLLSSLRIEFELGAAWQAERDAARIAELERRVDAQDRQIEARTVTTPGGRLFEARAEAAEAKLAAVKAELTKARIGGLGTGLPIAAQIARDIITIIDGTEIDRP